ncbi:DNA recombination protein RmuC [Roseivirga ehrenbergii]|uniref:Recombinase RmuC n=1 Tax=Roseivirga ehrenbergii (strain DSM 102268 / JCM 13514 / KCTC 12282 / NCIMB 14502 / KMM 6017) TaxID=279360 RepID=A0A150WY80_ROSEK|nr:DNA recombination protein RmuC [Roseivirga ehrenbergii]KYG71437.1 recombinase RmuC [Roseivirga ehrenbergii]TCK99512.1 DNA recombination protein RmuC [Roseivirga ehrenbergii]
MIENLLMILIGLSIVNIGINLIKKPKVDIKPQLKQVEDLMVKFDLTLERTEKSIKDEFQRNRTESNYLSKANREELTNSLKSFEGKFTENIKELNELLRQKFGDFSIQQNEINKQTTENVKEVKLSVENQLKSIREDNTKQLDEMRKTVDEKLQKTLNERLSQSFETVGKQLQAVQEGLGEMRSLATDVGGLKKVLSNVKMRGGIGEIQLSMLLEQILAPDQYEANVKTKASSADLVEFAIKLPGRDDSGTNVWLPIDAKFPKDIYEQLQEAYDEGDQARILIAQKNLDNTIKKMAKDISDKYIDPPNTTDFGIMFLPFEGIYAEVVRKAALLEDLQRNYKIIVTGPTTLAAILNSLQMGFKTLAIQKRSSEVWQVLGAVKKEFENFSGIMEKAQKNIQTGLNQLDDVMGKRTRAIQRKLKGVEALSEAETKNILPELSDGSLLLEDENDDL